MHVLASFPGAVKRFLQTAALLVFFLIPRASGDPLITEFLADNKASIVDEDNSHSDWAEIFNPDNAPVNMAGWYLSDKVSNPTQWQFPAVTIPSKGFLIVFLDSKDRHIPGLLLHTNFGLSKGGEALLLTKPDGVTTVSQYVFGAQIEDVSYGTCSTVESTILIQQGTPAKVLIPTAVDNSAIGTTWRNAGFDDSSWVVPSGQPGTLAVGYFNFGSTSNPDFSSMLGYNVSAQMGGGSGKSAYIRIPFNITDPKKVQELKFRIDYDDGFAAYLNGQLITASANAPSPLAYNSNTNQTHNPGTFADYDITDLIPDLVAGTNVLAIHGLNNGSSSDFFILPELTGRIDNPLVTPQTGFFSVATPGALNGGADTIQLPQTVTFSRAPGPFAGTFTLTMSGAGAGQKIYYNISDPNGNPAAGLSDPTPSSTLYSGAITISSNKLIRAAVFNTTNGQKGKTATAHYVLLESGATNNTSAFTSNLPIVLLDDHGYGNPVDSSTGLYTTALLYVFEPAGGIAALNSAPSFSSRAGFRIRGRTSATFPKRGYGLETWNEKDADLKVPLLGLPAESDWVFSNPYKYDDVFIHNAFIFEISRRIGRWAPRTRLAEVFANVNGGKLDLADYSGVYEICEKIERGENRLNITELGSEAMSGDALTGGYIFKIDELDPGEVGWTTPRNIKPVVVEPDVTSAEVDQAAPSTFNPVKKAQVDYLKAYVNAFETTLYAERNTNFATRNYRKYIDVPSWIDHSLLEILAFNVDAFTLSAYFHKDRNGKINAGPIWDFDRALNSDDGRDANPRQWNGMNIAPDWWGQLLRDPDYVQALVDRWWELRRGVFSDESLGALVDQLGSEVGAAAGARDAARWPGVDGNTPESGSYLGELAAMKAWLTSSSPGSLGRTNWIDSQFPKPPATTSDSGVVSPGTVITLSGTGTMRYTTNGTDPRPAGGSPSSSAFTYTGPITINQTTVLTVRTSGTFSSLPATVNISWGPPLTRVYLVNESFASAGDLTVSEINFNPLGPTDAETAAVPEVTADDFEFIELTNTGNRKVNTFEVKFGAGFPVAEAVLSARSLAPGEIAFLVKNREAFIARYGTSMAGKIIGEWKTGALSNAGATIKIFARDGSPIQEFSYSDNAVWPERADGGGSTLEYVGASFANADFSNPANWHASIDISGSPGTNGSDPDTRVVINEILAHSNSPRVDAIELHNRSGSVVDIGGWYLSDAFEPSSVAGYKQFRVPSGTVLAAGGYAVFTEEDFNPNGDWNPGAGTRGSNEFAFDAHHGDEAWLLKADLSGNALQFVDHVGFGATPADESIGRWPNGTGAMYPMQARTLLDENSGDTPRHGAGAANTPPRIGKLVVSEIVHSPSGGAVDLEFIEVRNTGAVGQSLAEWRIGGDVAFQFQAADSLSPGGLVVIVPFPPADSVKSGSFRTAHGIPASIPLLGPWTLGHSLGSEGDLVLYRADTPPADEPDYYPLLIEDQVRYSSLPPWPDAFGRFSLNRPDAGTLGDDAASWKLDIASPGTLGPTYAQWKECYFPGGGTGSNAEDDSDSDGTTNILEYSRGTDPRRFELHSAFTPSFAWQAGAGGGSYVFSFTKPVDRPASAYQVQQSTDLVSWTDVADIPVMTGPGLETRTVTVPILGNATPRLFFRLKVIVSP